MKTKNEKEAFESKERMLEIEMKVDIWKKESGWGGWGEGWAPWGARNQIMFYLDDRTILASSFRSWKPHFQRYEKSFSFLFFFVNVSILYLQNIHIFLAGLKY